MAGKTVGDKLISELNLYGQFKRVPDEIKHNIVLSDIHLFWEQKTKSFKTDGAPIGIGMIEKRQINKYVTGHFQLIRTKVKEEFSLYLEIDEKTWYYFNYSRGVMKCLSSMDDFNAIITALKPEKRETKGEKEEGPYTFMLGTERSVRTFLNDMNR